MGCLLALLSFWPSCPGLNSILFAINIDNTDLNGQSKLAPSVSELLKESTQNVTSLLKGSTQGVSSLLREISASAPVAILIRPEQDTDPLPVMSRSLSAGELGPVSGICYWAGPRQQGAECIVLVTCPVEWEENGCPGLWSLTCGAGISQDAAKHQARTRRGIAQRTRLVFPQEVASSQCSTIY